MVYDFQIYNLKISLMNQAFGKKNKARADAMFRNMKLIVGTEIFSMLAVKFFCVALLVYTPTLGDHPNKATTEVGLYHIFYLLQQGVSVVVLFIGAVYIVRKMKVKMREFDKSIESAFSNNVKKLQQVKMCTQSARSSCCR
jgi:hypothetical protein